MASIITHDSLDMTGFSIIDGKLKANGSAATVELTTKQKQKLLGSIVSSQLNMKSATPEIIAKYKRSFQQIPEEFYQSIINRYLSFWNYDHSNSSVEFFTLEQAIDRYFNPIDHLQGNSRKVLDYYSELGLFDNNLPFDLTSRLNNVVQLKSAYLNSSNEWYEKTFKASTKYYLAPQVKSEANLYNGLSFDNGQVYSLHVNQTPSKPFTDLKFKIVNKHSKKELIEVNFAHEVSYIQDTPVSSDLGFYFYYDVSTSVFMVVYYDFLNKQVVEYQYRLVGQTSAESNTNPTIDLSAKYDIVLQNNSAAELYICLNDGTDADPSAKITEYYLGADRVYDLRNPVYKTSPFPFMYPLTTEYGLYKETYNRETRQYPLTDEEHFAMSLKIDQAALPGNTELRAYLPLNDGALSRGAKLGSVQLESFFPDAPKKAISGDYFYAIKSDAENRLWCDCTDAEGLEIGRIQMNTGSETLMKGVSHVMITAKWQGGHLSGKPKPKPEV